MFFSFAYPSLSVSLVLCHVSTDLEVNQGEMHPTYNNSDERLDTQQTLAHLDKADNVNTNAHYTNIFQAKKKKNMLELDWFLEGAERVAWKSSPNKQLIYPPSL